MAKTNSPPNRTPSPVVFLHSVEEVLGLTAATACERYERLSRRERQVAAMIAAGTPNRQIARELGITSKTVDIHRANIKAKLAARTLVEIANLVNLAKLAGLSHGHVETVARSLRIIP